MSKPLKTLRDGSVELTVWKNEKDGKVFYSTTFTNNYKPEGGEWTKSQNFAPNELLKLQRLIDQGYQAIADDKTSNS